jgi:hypothetical protein
MNEWSKARRRNALLIALVFILVVVAFPIYYFTREVPTCFDNKQNGDETGVDCGGSCTLLCGAESLPIIMKGDPRLLKVASSTYELVAYATNPNPSSAVLKASYTFSLYEASSTLPVKTVTGFTYVPKGVDFAIFEGPFDLGDKVPTRTTFSWDNTSLVWAKDNNPSPSLDITDASISHASTTPRVDATITNASLTAFQNIYLITLILNDSGTIMAASKTYVDALRPNETAPVVFTWPSAFKDVPASVKILPMVLPDSSYIK